MSDGWAQILAERDSALEEERLRLHHDYQERERKLRDTLEQTLQHKEESLQEHLRSEREKLEQQESARLEQHAIRVRDLEKERLEMDKRMSVQLSKRLAKEREVRACTCFCVVCGVWCVCVGWRVFSLLHKMSAEFGFRLAS